MQNELKSSIALSIFGSFSGEFFAELRLVWKISRTVPIYSMFRSDMI